MWQMMTLRPWKTLRLQRTYWTVPTQIGEKAVVILNISLTIILSYEWLIQKLNSLNNLHNPSPVEVLIVDSI